MIPTLLTRWAVRPLAGIMALGLLVTLAEKRFRRVRKQLLQREDEFWPDAPAEPSFLANKVRTASQMYPGLSGQRLLADGPSALAARLTLARAAGNTLDLQYYTWDDDLAGRIMARAVLRAAGRGVRVRILLDDLHAYSTRRLVGLLAAHPRVTVRVYNPSVTRRAYFVNWLFSFRRLNRRMHNKAIVADGVATILGGRNIGDTYFGLAADVNFRDIDVLTVGPAAEALGASFERFWGSTLAMPSAAFGVVERADEAEVEAALSSLDQDVLGRLEQLRREGRLQSDPAALLAEGEPDVDTLLTNLDWARSTVLVDEPGEAAGTYRLKQSLWGALGNVKTSLDIEAGYLIPDQDDLKRFRALTERGVKVRVLTNSLATSDVLPAQVAYARHRKALLSAGVEVYELQSDAKVRRALSLLGSSGGAGLHSKVLIADERLSVIGSHNLDPRSADQNTEVVLLVESKTFAYELAATMTPARSPGQSYQVELRGGRLIWTDNGEVRTREPGATWWARLLSVFMRAFPVERLL